jgi:hypothetical protein
MGWYLTGQSIWYIILVSRREQMSFSQVLSEAGPAVSLALACYGFLGALYPFALVCYHFYLIFSGQNTHEYVRIPQFQELIVSYGINLCRRTKESFRIIRVTLSKTFSPYYVGRSR